MTQAQDKDMDKDMDTRQQGQSRQNAQPEGPPLTAGSGAVLHNNPQTQLDPQAPNRDRYGDQETGATSGEVGDRRDPRQVAHSGSQATQHSAGGSLQQDSERARQETAKKQP